MPVTHLSRRALGVAGLVAAVARPAILRAQPAAAPVWPERPVRLIVPFGAGGAADTLARTMAQAFPEEANGQNLIVENRGGGAGTIAGAAVAQARPDGHTLMIADLGPNAIAQEMMQGLAYDPPHAFTPIIHLINLPVVLLTRSGLPVRTAAELFAYARAQREPLTYAHPGIGYPSQLAQELILQLANIRAVPVAYRSGAEVMRSIVSEETDMAIPTVSSSRNFIAEGKAKPIAVLSRNRVAQLPEVPLLADTLPGFEANVWHGVSGPAGMPPAVVAAANRVFNTILRRPEVAQRLQANQAAELVGGSAEAFAATIEAEIVRWTPLIRSAGLRAE